MLSSFPLKLKRACRFSGRSVVLQRFSGIMLITSCSILETCPSVLWLYFFFSLFLYRTCLIPLPVLSGLWGWRMCVLELPFPCWAPRIVSAWTCFCLGSFPSGFRIDFCLSFLSLCLLKFYFWLSSETFGWKMLSDICLWFDNFYC